ncbi:MAG: hypothetical protein AB1390_05660 [Nitrospirota bacterium]
MKTGERIVLFFSIIFPFYIFLVFSIIQPLLGAINLKSINEKNLLSAISYDGDNATYHYLLARDYHNGGQRRDLQLAVGSYKKSLRLNPLQGGCWLDLAKAYQTAGMTKEAGYAIKRAINLLPQNPQVMWEAGVFYLVNAEIEEAAESFKRLILLEPERQEVVYDLLWRIPLDSEFVFKNLIPQSYSYHKHYLIYLMSTDRIDEAKDLWKSMKKFEVEEQVLLKYVDFLISRRHYEDAQTLWKEYVAKRFGAMKDGSLLWNGSFEHDVINGGFDWKVNEVAGVDAYLDRDIHMHGSRSLGLVFDGTQNPDITIASQVVRVNPGARYVLKANLKTDSLTTTNGLFLAAEGHDCPGFSRESDVLAGTNFWKEISLELEIPADCHAISVMVRRERSQKLDNKISGNAWIDEISLTQK